MRYATQLVTELSTVENMTPTIIVKIMAIVDAAIETMVNEDVTERLKLAKLQVDADARRSRPENAPAVKAPAPRKAKPKTVVRTSTINTTEEAMP